MTLLALYLIDCTRMTSRLNRKESMVTLLYNGYFIILKVQQKTSCQELCDRMIAGICNNKKRATKTLISWVGTWKRRRMATVMFCCCLAKNGILTEKWLSIDTPQPLVTEWLCTHQYTVVCCCLTNWMGVQTDVKTDLLHLEIRMKQIHLDPHLVS